MQRLLKYLLLGASFCTVAYAAVFVRVSEWSSPHLKRIAFGMTYRNRPLTGVTYERVGSHLTKIAFYLHGSRHGPEIHWGPLGKRIVERHYSWGIEDGEQLGWYENGSARYRKHFVKGIAQGEFFDWHPNGNLSQLILYEAGREIGAKSWTGGGKPFHNYVWRNGQRIGLEGDRFCSIKR